MTDIPLLKEKLAQACRVIGLLDLTKATTGHLSLRIPGTDHFLIRARGDFESGVRFTAADDVITVDLNGKKIEGREDLSPPREVFIHTWLYKTRPNIGAVVHAHPPTLMLFTVCICYLFPDLVLYIPFKL